MNNLDQANDLSAYDKLVGWKVARFWDQRVGRDWGGKILLRGKTPKADDVLVNHNDYLSIGAHPLIRRAQADSLRKTTEGTLMSAVFFAGTNEQSRLEDAFAQLLGHPSAIITQSGYTANVGLIKAISDEQTPVYIDMLAHMSLWDGIGHAGARAIPFRHNAVAHLHRQIEAHGPGVVVVDSVYSTDGSICPLREIASVCELSGCVLVVDESHSLGLYGENGAGMIAELGLTAKVDFITASLAKAFAGRAGLITCPREFHHYLLSVSHPAIFSSALLPYECAGLFETIKVIKTAHNRRSRLHANARQLREGLQTIGYGVSSKSQIVGLEVGAEIELLTLRDRLEDRGIFGAPFCPPATPNNRALMRLSVHANLQTDEINRILNACEDAYHSLGADRWRSTRRLRH